MRESIDPNQSLPLFEAAKIVAPPEGYYLERLEDEVFTVFVVEHKGPVYEIQANYGYQPHYEIQDTHINFFFEKPEDATQIMIDLIKAGARSVSLVERKISKPKYIFKPLLETTYVGEIPQKGPQPDCDVRPGDTQKPE
jgi:hypothetical protein